MLQLARRFSVRARIALVVALALVAAGTSPRAAAVPEKGTEILWDTYGIPHIFAPDHPSLFYAYGYAQMEGHAELLTRLYAQARGRGAEFYGDAYLASDRWVRTTGIPQKAKQWETQQSPEFGALIRAFAAGLNAWVAKNPDVLSAQAKRVLPFTAGRRLCAWPAHHSLRLADQRTERLSQGAAGSDRDARLQRLGDRAVEERDRQRDADEQFAFAVVR